MIWWTETKKVRLLCLLTTLSPQEPLKFLWFGELKPKKYDCCACLLHCHLTAFSLVQLMILDMCILAEDAFHLRILVKSHLWIIQLWFNLMGTNQKLKQFSIRKKEHLYGYADGEELLIFIGCRHVNAGHLMRKII